MGTHQYNFPRSTGFFYAAAVLLLAACGSAASQMEIAAPSVSVASTTPTPLPTATSTPEPTATPLPDPEVSFEELQQIQSSWGSFSFGENGNLIYNSPLYSQVGKNIPTLQQYREVGLSGKPEIWIAPSKYPDAPMFVQDVDTGEIRQGPFRYDDDVRRRLTLPASGVLYKTPIMEGMQGAQPALNFAETMDFNGLKIFAISALSIGELLEQSGHLLMPVKSYIGDEDDYFALYYHLALGPTDPKNGHWNPFYDTYRSGNEHSYYLEHILNGAGNFSGRIGLHEQMLIVGLHAFSSRESIPQNFYSSNYYYAYDYMPESQQVIFILQNAGLPADLELGGTEIRLFGNTAFVSR